MGWTQPTGQPVRLRTLSGYYSLGTGAADAVVCLAVAQHGLLLGLAAVYTVCQSVFARLFLLEWHTYVFALFFQRDTPLCHSPHRAVAR